MHNNKVVFVLLDGLQIKVYLNEVSKRYFTIYCKAKARDDSDYNTKDNAAMFKIDIYD